MDSLINMVSSQLKHQEFDASTLVQEYDGVSCQALCSEESIVPCIDSVQKNIIPTVNNFSTCSKLMLFILLGKRLFSVHVAGC
jgi:hypothetical protein